MTQAEMRSYGERSVADIGTERRDKAESWRENQREREDAEKGKFGGKESETRQRSRKENMARAQEIAIWGRRNQLVTNPIQSNPILCASSPSPAFTSPKGYYPRSHNPLRRIGESSKLPLGPRTTTSRKIGMARLRKGLNVMVCGPNHETLSSSSAR